MRAVPFTDGRYTIHGDLISDNLTGRMLCETLDGFYRLIDQKGDIFIMHKSLVPVLAIAPRASWPVQALLENCYVCDGIVTSRRKTPAMSWNTPDTPAEDWFYYIPGFADHIMSMRGIVIDTKTGEEIKIIRGHSPSLSRPIVDDLTATPVQDLMYLAALVNCPLTDKVKVSGLDFRSGNLYSATFVPYPPETPEPRQDTETVTSIDAGKCQTITGGSASIGIVAEITEAVRRKGLVSTDLWDTGLPGSLRLCADGLLAAFRDNDNDLWVFPVSILLKPDIYDMPEGVIHRFRDCPVLWSGTHDDGTLGKWEYTSDIVELLDEHPTLAGHLSLVQSVLHGLRASTGKHYIFDGVYGLNGLAIKYSDVD